MFCATCPAFQPPPPAPVGQLPVVVRGHCKLYPQGLPKLPTEWCMQHPARAAAMTAIAEQGEFEV